MPLRAFRSGGRERSATQRRDQDRQVGRQRDVELHELPGSGVHQAEVRSVQGQPIGPHRVLVGAAVDRVSQDRVSEVGEVDPHLVRAAGAELRLDERRPSQPVDRPDDGVRGAAPAARRQCGAPGARSGPSDGPRDDHLPREVAGGEGEVAAAHRMGPELALQVLGGPMGARQHHGAGGLAVEAVDDMHPPRSGEPVRQLDHEAREHRILLLLAGRVNQHAGGLVHDHQVVVEVEQLDPRPTCPWSAPRQVREMGDLGAGGEHETGVGDHHAIDGYMPDQDLPLGTAVRRAEELLHATGQPNPFRWTSHGLTIPPAPFATLSR